jgi:hypothetical protein
VPEFAPVTPSLPLTGGANSDTAPYQDARWNPAFVEDDALLRFFEETFEASREPAGVPGVARAVAGVSTARAGARVGDPGLGPPDGLFDVRGG